jgi:hypothetical protein
MKITVADVLTSLFLIAFFGALFLGLNSCEKEDTRKIKACVDNPSRETCQPCADNPAKKSDICRSILAGIILEENKK